MKITTKGLTTLTGACDLAEDHIGRRVRIEDLDFGHHPTAGNAAYSIVLRVDADDADRDIVGTGSTFDTAAGAFRQACEALR